MREEKAGAGCGRSYSTSLLLQTGGPAAGGARGTGGEPAPPPAARSTSRASELLLRRVRAAKSEARWSEARSTRGKPIWESWLPDHWREWRPSGLQSWGAAPRVRTGVAGTLRPSKLEALLGSERVGLVGLATEFRRLFRSPYRSDGGGFHGVRRSGLPPDTARSWSQVLGGEGRSARGKQPRGSSLSWLAPDSERELFSECRTTSSWLS